MEVLSIEKLKEIAIGCGLNLLGLVSAQQLDPTKEECVNMQQWLDSGYQGEMAYLNKPDPSKRGVLSCFPEARSVLVLSLAYPRTPVIEVQKGYGKVARYAWGRDYHKVMPRLMKLLESELKTILRSEFRSWHKSDATPLLERSIAAKTTAGFIGKNTLFIQPKMGSFSLLGELIIDREIVEGSSLTKVSNETAGRCGTCQRCLDSCPTGALEEEHVLNASKCISYLTIEKRGIFTGDQVRMIGEWLFGCDICQEVCPFNHSELKKNSLPILKDEYVLIPQAKRLLEEFCSEKNGPVLDLREVLALRTNEQYLERFAGTPLMRTKREGLLRNACAVAVNQKDRSMLPCLNEVYNFDSSALIRDSAASAIQQIASKG